MKNWLWAQEVKQRNDDVRTKNADPMMLRVLAALPVVGVQRRQTQRDGNHRTKNCRYNTSMKQLSSFPVRFNP